MELWSLDCDPLLSINEWLINLWLPEFHLALKDLCFRVNADKKVVDGLLARNWKLHWSERIEINLLMITSWALQGRFELAIHQVNDNWLISLEMDFPKCFGNIFVLSFQIWHLNILFLFNAIKIFMECVKKPVEEFHWVLLIEPFKQHISFTNRTLEKFRPVWRLIVWLRLLFCPQIEKNLSKPWYNISFSPKGVRKIDFISEAHAQEIVTQQFWIAQALKSTIHIARITHVSKS